MPVARVHRNYGGCGQIVLLLRAVMRAITPVLAVLLFLPTSARAQTFTMLGGSSAVVNHYPGADGLVGNGDDVVSGDISSTVGSDPNYRGDFSHAVGASFGTDPALPNPHNAVMFLQGSVDVDANIAQNGSGALVTDFLAHGTAFRQGLPLDSLEATTVNSGTFNTGTNAVTLNVDFDAVINGITQSLEDVDVTGIAFVINSTDFGNNTGNTYVDNVLLPLAASASASDLLFLQVSGTLPMTLPLVLIPTPFQLTIVGLAGVAAGDQADLEIEKTSDVDGFAMAGDTVEYTLKVTNNGPADAAGVVVTDRLDDRVTHMGNDCGASVASGLLTWSIANLANQAMVTCKVTITLDADANFDHENGAFVTATSIDSDLSNNTGRIVVPDRDPGPEGLCQLPDGITGFQADADCDACNGGSGGSQAVADNFKVNDAVMLKEIVFYGAYSDNVPFVDDFTIQIFSNNDASEAPGPPGVPGTPIAQINGLVSRSPTGQMVAGRPEFEYRVRTMVPLTRGIYWVVIYNDSSGVGGNGDWFWETGSADLDNRSVPGVAASVRIPIPPIWGTTAEFQLALKIETGPFQVPSPALGPIGLALVVLVLVLPALRRARV